MKNIILLLFFLLSFIQCGSIMEDMNKSWIGKTKQDIIMKYGPIEKEDSDGQNGKIYTYEERIKKSGGVEYFNGKPVGNKPDYFVNRRTMFYVNAEGKVYNILVKDDELY